MPVIIWHNPRCSKSRATLALLESRGFAPEVVRYLDAPPGPAEIIAAAALLGMPLRDLARRGEAAWKGVEAADDAALAAAMSAHPILIERPVVFANGRAAIGRPPEAVLAIL